MSVKTMKVTADMLAERDKRIAELGDVLIVEQDENARLVERIAELEAECDKWIERSEKLWEALQQESEAQYIYFAFNWFDEKGKARKEVE